MAAVAAVSAQNEPGLLVRIASRPTAMAGLVIVALMVVLSLLAPVISPYSPSQLAVRDRLLGPGFLHLMGTDELGRDVLTRVLHSGRTSLTVGFAVVIFAAAIGVTLGLVAGFFRKLDAPVSRLIDAMMAFPDILLAIALVAALGPSAVNVVFALGTVYAPRLARVVRAPTLVIRELPYVEAARALGVPTPIILVRHVLRTSHRHFWFR